MTVYQTRLSLLRSVYVSLFYFKFALMFFIVMNCLGRQDSSPSANLVKYNI